MSRNDIKSWIAYWTAAHMVSFDAIQAFDQVYQARKYCSCLRQGVFTDVTDGQIWDALCEMRRDAVSAKAA